MHVSARTYLTSGIAVLGAGAIALSPVQPIPDHVALVRQHVVSDLAVDLDLLLVGLVIGSGLETQAL